MLSANSCLTFNPHKRMVKTFTATIFETDQIFQDVVCYLDNWYDDGTADVSIKMPLFIQPSSLRNDVEVWLEENYGMSLGYLKYELAPQNVTIYP